MSSLTDGTAKILSLENVNRDFQNRKAKKKRTEYSQTMGQA